MADELPPEWRASSTTPPRIEEPERPSAADPARRNRNFRTAHVSG